MTEETNLEVAQEVAGANLDAAVSPAPEETKDENLVDASPVEAPASDGAVSLDNAGSVGTGETLINQEEIVPTTGGAVPTDPLLLATIQVFRSRFDGQFFIKADTGEGYSAPNASTAGHVGGNLVAAIVQESINSKFEYAAGAA